jgi:hypothetical protein
VAQCLESAHPLAFPLFAAIAPSSTPFTLAPWIPDSQEFLSMEFDGFEYSIGMTYTGRSEQKSLTQNRNKPGMMPDQFVE